MKLQIKDLNFNYISLANFYGPYLPYNKSSIEEAFPGTLVKDQEVETAYGSKSRRYSIYVDGIDKPVFDICPAPDAWFNDATGEWAGVSYSVAITDSPAMIFGKFQVGKTTLKEFQDEHLMDFDTGLGGSRWVIKDPLFPEVKEHLWLRGGREAKLYNSSFIFYLSDEYEGPIDLAPKEILEKAVLHSVSFEFSDMDALPPNIMGIKLPQEDSALLAEKKKVLEKAVKTSKTPLEIVIENQHLRMVAERAKSFTKKSALEGYLKLSELMLHNIDPVILKEKIKDAFKSTKKRKSMDLFQQILNIEHVDWKQFFLELDWKDGALEFDQRIRQNLSKIDAEKIPVTSSKTAMISDVLEEYENNLKQIGVELLGIDTENDQYVFCLYKTEDKISVVEQLAKTQIYFLGG